MGILHGDSILDGDTGWRCVFGYHISLLELFDKYHCDLIPHCLRWRCGGGGELNCSPKPYNPK